MWIFVWVCVCMCSYECGSQRPTLMSSSISSVLSQDLILNPKLISLARLLGQWTSQFACLYSYTWGYRGPPSHLLSVEIWAPCMPDRHSKVPLNDTNSLMIPPKLHKKEMIKNKWFLSVYWLWIEGAEYNGDIKTYLNISWLYNVFLYFLISLSMSSTPKIYFKQSSEVTSLIWLLESRSYLVSSCPLSCFALCYNIISLILLDQSKN